MKIKDTINLEELQKNTEEPTKEQWTKWANHKSNKDKWCESHQ